jgi:hypothetical protein
MTGPTGPVAFTFRTTILAMIIITSSSAWKQAPAAGARQDYANAAADHPGFKPFTALSVLPAWGDGWVEAERLERPGRRAVGEQESPPTAHH